jgi:hypothetical protein
MTQAYRWYVSNTNGIGIARFVESSNVWQSPQETDLTIRLHYRKDHPLVTSMETPIEIPRRYHGILLHGVIANLTEILGGKSGINRQHFDRGIMQIKKDTMKGVKTRHTMVSYNI